MQNSGAVQPKSANGRATFLIVCAFIVLFTYFGLKDVLNNQALAGHGTATTGVVTSRWTTAASSKPATGVYAIKYDYTVSGIRYSGTANPDKEVYDQTQIGDRLTVTYLPESPATSQLSTAPVSKQGVFSLGAGAIMVLGIVVVVTGKARKRTQGR